MGQIKSTVKPAELGHKRSTVKSAVLAQRKITELGQQWRAALLEDQDFLVVM